MTVAVPISAEQRDRIVALAARGMSRNAIVREVGVSGGTVRKYAEAAGYSFDRSKTKKATAAAKIDNAATRAAIVAKILAKLDAAVDAIDITGISQGPQATERVLRGLASASRSFADAAKASPLPQTDSNDAIRSMVGELITTMAASLEVDNYGRPDGEAGTRPADITTGGQA